MCDEIIYIVLTQLKITINNMLWCLQQLEYIKISVISTCDKVTGPAITTMICDPHS